MLRRNNISFKKDAKKFMLFESMLLKGLIQIILKFRAKKNCAICILRGTKYRVRE